MKKHKRTSVKVPKSSIVLNLEPIMTLRNIPHPSAFLIKQGLNRGSVGKMLKGEAVQLNFQQLTTLCFALNCTPNDLFSLREMNLPELHALKALPEFVPKAKKTSVTEWLAGKSVAEIKELMQQ
ncbi:helix-turn-helix domain-containing protein [Flavobacterium sp. PLA-1-15]|uniref:helix-turn-helix domain-containing protein n=1 Tax=Flavobacterium sp. PLA-1-15 TaxID=3380533 RepID=UPI003B7BF628